MLTINEIPNTNILEFTLDGSLSRAEFDQLAAIADKMIETHGKVKVIEIIKNIGKIEPSAIWADLKWEPRHLKYFSHVAVVCDQKWIEWIVAACKVFISAEMKTFHLDELEEARDWIKSASESDKPKK
tara:strand:- start:3281 stop:3664 length:384 start_codon:yes stop_codon:yes gene_type:complete